MTLGTPRVHRTSTASTSVDARALALAGAPHGTLVTAHEQQEGRGRHGRRWHAPRGGALLCSLVLRDPPALLPIAAAVAVAELVGPEAKLKWPNDVLVHHRKVSGILVEGRPQEHWAVLGIGVNVAVRIDDLPADVRKRAASLELPSSAIEPIMDRLLEALERRLAEPADSVLDAWRARDALLGRDVSWAHPKGTRQGHGRAEGIDGEGRLLVRLDDGTTTALSAGEVHLASVG